MQLQEQEHLRARICSVYLSDASQTYMENVTSNLINEDRDAAIEVLLQELYINMVNTSRPFLSEICIYHDSYRFLGHITLSENMIKCICIPIPEEAAVYTVEFISCYGDRTYGSFLVDSGFDEEGDRSPGDERIKQAHLKNYYFYGTIPPKREGTSNADT